jgi:tRNA (guanine37-N1)-methyltransferase
MQFDIITLFPNLVNAMFSESIIRRAAKQELIQINIHDLRKYTSDPRKSADDKPFGGGPGMLMLLEPIYLALKDIGVYPVRDADTKVILTSAKGETWNQKLAQTYSSDIKRLVIICGHYEGVDHRVNEHLIDGEISIGDYVLTGGELAAAVMVDSIGRLLPGVLGNAQSLIEESHNDMLEYPQYTRPANFVTAEGETWNVPDILLSGHHAQIEAWKKENSSN